MSYVFRIFLITGIVTILNKRPGLFPVQAQEILNASYKTVPGGGKYMCLQGTIFISLSLYKIISRKNAEVLAFFPSHAAAVVVVVFFFMEPLSGEVFVITHSRREIDIGPMFAYSTVQGSPGVGKALGDLGLYYYRLAHN